MILDSILKNASNLYVLDLSWHLHRNYNCFRNMGIDIDGYMRPTGHLYGVLNTIKTIKNIDSSSVIFITQDGTPKERIESLGKEGIEYKEGRPDLEFNFYKDIPIIKAASCILDNVYWAYNEDKECDDLMYALCKKACKVESFKGKCFVSTPLNFL